MQIEGGAPVTCLFNPQQYTMSKTNHYTAVHVAGASFTPPQFVGGAPRELTLELLFDVTLSKPVRPSVRPITDALFKMMEVPAAGSPTAGKAPPTVIFRWGAFVSFKAVASRLEVQYVLFKPNGEPVRAWVRLDLLQVAPSDSRTGSAVPAAQNPTTRAHMAGASRTVVQGDSLQSLAHEVYGDPTRWREIAHANRITDPQRLRPGRQLAIPGDPT